MLRKLYVHNFKTLLNFTFEPKGVNLLIGRNNAGKTNLCQALRFLSLTASGKLMNASVISTGSTQSFTNRYAKDAVTEFVCECELPDGAATRVYEYRLSIEFAERLAPDAGPRVVSETLRVDGRNLLSNVDGRLHEVEGQDAEMAKQPGVYIGMGMAMPPDTTALRLFLSDSPTSPLTRRFRSFLMSWAFYDLESSRLRETRATQGDVTLEEDGRNLAWAVHALKARDDRAYREVLEIVRTLEPDLEAITFPQSPDPNQVFMAFEDKERRKFRPEELSNGTLRMLALAYLIAQNRSQAETEEALPGLVVYEEPETGIFVGHLKRFFEALDRTGRHGQYIFTTHAPYFIDLFDGNLDGVFLLKRERTHTVLVKPDKEKIGKLLGEFSLGELHFREMLDA